MNVSGLNFNNYRCFENENFALSPGINILIGPNNSGKSSIIKSLRALQEDGLLGKNDVRKETTAGNIHYYFENTDSRFSKLIDSKTASRRFQIDSAREEAKQNGIWIPLDHDNDKAYLSVSGMRLATFDNVVGSNFIFPFLSNRKTYGFSKDTQEQFADSVDLDLNYLNSKIDKLMNKAHTSHLEFERSVKKITGININTYHTYAGKEAGIYINEKSKIPLEELGAGVPNIIGLISSLCLANRNLFLFEEIENDIHPKALKGILELIKSKSLNNQFVISTHSNIVLRELAELENTQILNIRSKKVKARETPKSNIIKVETTVDRRRVLEEMGYSLSDLELFTAWILFEESSIERIVNHFLIPWFAPKLNGQVGTISSNGFHKISQRFDELSSNFLFLNKSKVYHNKIWVIIDSGVDEEKEIKKLKQSYVGKNKWREGNFIQLSKHDFEDYYPSLFSDRVNYIKSCKSGQKNRVRKLKKELIYDVINWANNKPDQAKEMFEESAKEIIQILKGIEKTLFA